MGRLIRAKRAPKRPDGDGEGFGNRTRDRENTAARLGEYIKEEIGIGFKGLALAVMSQALVDLNSKSDWHGKHLQMSAARWLMRVDEGEGLMIGMGICAEILDVDPEAIQDALGVPEKFEQMLCDPSYGMKRPKTKGKIVSGGRGNGE